MASVRGVFWAAAAVLCGVAAGAQAAPPPASAFGRVPAVVDAEISPNGQRIAILGGTSEQRVISIATIDQPGLPVLQLGAVEGVDLRWAGDDHVLARIAFWEREGPKISYRFERNVVVTPEAKPVTRLLENDTLSRALVGQPVFGITDGAKPQVMVMGLIERGAMSNSWDTRIKRKDFGIVAALWMADPETGKGVIVDRGGPDTVSWSVDSTGQPRVRLEIDQLNHDFSIFGRPGGKGQWQEVWKGDSFKSRRDYYGYSQANDSIYLWKGEGLVARRLADGVETPVGQTAGHGSLQLSWDQHTDALVGLSTGAERASTEWLDPEIGAAHGLLTRALKGRDVVLWGWSRDRTRFIARAAAPSSPGAWYLYDKARKEISPIGEEYPELKGATLGTTRWITYKARDGLEIPAYLTLPPGAQAGAKLPLIVYPHGGPRARDTFDFDFIAQFLATRGYAVLQPQFRGSWGFGAAFEAAGTGEWGGKMQTDLLDGIAALAKSGEIDSSRVCIVGASFGGYSALAGATLQDRAYRCAASIAGMSDLGLLLVEEARRYGRDAGLMDELREEVGAASTAKLDASSPLRHAAAAVRTPILLIHGDQDTVVPIEQSELMAAKLKDLNIPHEFIVLQNENHYLTRSATRTQTLEALERFLAKNLPVN
ncbi:MAG: S9 family peptidase [Phenylobacterium sp.]|uniref:alpha/beta hydrolase family protein n=1 Tax=Phenylobacterium sp. TaxID=1871053 RepID=UPI0011FB336E|nr:S9 family peptidase [Phenylobacterium sp.]TAJ74104.1 MAG: S9 family peptidase [Phenylobacterium sp.]